MKPTTEEKEWLKDYLYQIMNYRETYEEVYDHILLAIENAPKQVFFESVVLKIIEDDFGGNNGLMEIEEKCRQAAEATAKAQYKDNFKRWFLSPLVIVTLTVFMLLLKLQQLKGVGLWAFLFFILLLLAPYPLLALRGFALGYKYAQTKTAIRDEIIRKITFKSNSTFFRIYIYIQICDVIMKYVFHFQPLVHQTHNTILILGGILSAIIVLLLIHLLSVINLYRLEFKMNITT